MDKKKLWDNYKFPLILLGGIFIGAILGLVMGEKASVFEPLGQIFLNLMFTIVVPMVFVSITTAVGNMLNMKRLGKILGSLVLTFVVTGIFAAALVLVVVNIWPPAANTTIAMGAAEMDEASSISDMIVGALTVNDFSGLMSRSNMLPIIVFAIMSGLAVAACGGQESPAEAFPLIATIGFLVDPAATCLNASGDTIASMVITRLVEGKDWLEKRLTAGEIAE